MTLTFNVRTVRMVAHGSLAHCKAAVIPLDTDLSGVLRRHVPGDSERNGREPSA